MKAFFALTVVAAIAGAAATGPLADDNWPQWRGPLQSGVAPEGDPPVEWAADRIRAHSRGPHDPRAVRSGSFA